MRPTASLRFFEARLYYNSAVLLIQYSIINISKNPSFIRAYSVLR